MSYLALNHKKAYPIFQRGKSLRYSYRECVFYCFYLDTHPSSYINAYTSIWQYVYEGETAMALLIMHSCLLATYRSGKVYYV